MSPEARLSTDQTAGFPDDQPGRGWFTRLAGWAGLLATLIGLDSLIAWVSHRPLFSPALSMAINMKTNTALGLMLAGVGLFLSARFPAGHWARKLAMAGAVFVALLGLATLGEMLFGWNLGIDEILFNELPGAIAPFGPNRMVPATAVCLFFVGTALVLAEIPAVAVFANVPTFLALGLSFPSLLGHIYGASSFAGLGVYFYMAAPTSIAFQILGAGILFLGPDRGSKALLIVHTAEGKYTVRLLLLVGTLFPLLGWLGLEGLRLGRYQPEFGAALIVTAAGVAITALVLWNARSTVNLVNARRQASLHQAELAAIIESSTDAIIGKDLAGRITSWNGGAERLFGYQKSEMIGQPVTKLVPPEFSKEEASLQAQISRGEIINQFETLRVTRDGRRFAASVVLSPIKNEAGEIVGVSKVVRDISERKASEQKIRRLSQLYEALSHCNQAIVRCRSEAQLFSEICRAAVEFGGMKMAWIGTIETDPNCVKPVAFHGDGTGYLADIHITVAAENPTSRGPTGTSVRENRPVWIQDFLGDPRTIPWHESGKRYGWGSSGALPLTRSGAVIGAFTLYSGEPFSFDEQTRNLLVEMAADISYALENFAHEKERKKALAALHLQSAALAATVDSVVITNVRGEIEWVNPAFTKITGYEPAEVIGQKPSILKSGRQADAYYAEMWKTISTGRSWSGEFVNRRKDGSLFTEEVTIAPVRDHSGTVTHFVAVKQDITEKQSLEKQLFQTQRLESIGMLASGIAHDLNNVLAPISLSIELLRVQYPGSGQKLEMIEKSCRRGADIIRQVLTFARGADGERTRLQVGRLVKEMAHMISETFPRNIEIAAHVPRINDHISGDPTQIHQVLLNLCVNARDAMPNGGRLDIGVERATLDEAAARNVAGARPGEFVVLTIRDTGTGIPPEIMAHIFEPFFTTKPRGQGTGLGLSTVHGIVRSHGGYIQVHSQPGLGTEFRVHLPALPPDEQVNGTTASATPFGAGRGETILVADDEASIRDITGLVLERQGYTPLLAKNGAEALALFEANREKIKLAILDRMMPGANGEDIARIIHKTAPALPIFLSTGLLTEGQRPGKEQELKQTGIRAILHKPYSEAVLLKLVGETLGA